MSGGKIFISYRRADSQWAAARLHDTLAAAFPDDHLFMDVEDIAPGQDFVDVLVNQVGACDVFLALIGPEWLSMRTEDGRRRLDDPEDFVRVEIGSALARESTLTIPVILDGAAPPAEADLPQDLSALARRQFVRLTHEGFRTEVSVLIDAIKTKLVATPPPPAAPVKAKTRSAIDRRVLFGLGAAAIVAAVGWFGYERLSAPPDPAGSADLTTFVECDGCPEMIVVPAGGFMMGSAADDPWRSSSEGPQRAVTVPRFALARTELSRSHYDLCVAEEACPKLPRHGPPSDDEAATHVRFVDALAYVGWLNSKVPGEPYRLPSEAEWEYAARAGSETHFPWGDDWDRAFGNMGREVCCIGHAEGPDKWKGVAPIGQFQANPYGFHDMFGNLSEWVADVYESDLSRARTDGSPYIWESDSIWGRRHVIKGGSYSDRPCNTRPAARQSNDKEWVLGSFGVRIARDLTPR